MANANHLLNNISAATRKLFPQYLKEFNFCGVVLEIFLFFNLFTSTHNTEEMLKLFVIFENYVKATQKIFFLITLHVCSSWEVLRLSAENVKIIKTGYNNFKYTLKQGSWINCVCFIQMIYSFLKTNFVLDLIIFQPRSRLYENNKTSREVQLPTFPLNLSFIIHGTVQSHFWKFFKGLK